MAETKKQIDEYAKDYCLFLEATYGPNMMSEGGTIAIERMFTGTNLQGKTVLDIGAGLGGAAFYVADRYEAKVTGLELTDWMVEEAKSRTPAHLKSRVQFVAYKPPQLVFDDSSFDVVYSKGVLTHVRDKLPLFKEVFRILKRGGYFIIDDWLSSVKDRWGNRLQKMCETENLTLYAETETNYRKILEQCGFLQIEMRDENKNYAQYNQDVINRLQKQKITEQFKSQFGEDSLKQAIEGYQLISDSIRDNELLIRWIRGKKL